MKRLIDLFVSFLVLLLLSPIFLIISIILLVFLGKPVIFSQIRPGKNERPFFIYKFRTMANSVDEDGNLLPNEQRRTKFGDFLRSTSLDELPEFFNVLIGNMSLVGPRPLLMDYLPLFNEYQKRRHEVKPGITGWAQINGRNSISWDEKFDLDLWYVENQSLLLDIKILIITIIKVIKREGISHNEGFSMPRFTGNQQMNNM